MALIRAKSAIEYDLIAGENVVEWDSDTLKSINGKDVRIKKSQITDGTQIKTLWEGDVIIPSKNSGNRTTIITTDKISNYDYVIVSRSLFSMITMSKEKKEITDLVGSYNSDFGIEGMNTMMMTIMNADTLNPTIGGNVYTGIRTNGAGAFDGNYAGINLVKIVGIKI